MTSIALLRGVNVGGVRIRMPELAALFADLGLQGVTTYLHTPDGIGRSKLTVDWFERRLGLRATARNWNTVGALLAIGHQCPE